MLDLPAAPHKSLRLRHCFLFSVFFFCGVKSLTTLSSPLCKFFSFGYCIFEVYTFHLVLLHVFHYFSETVYPSICFKIMCYYFLKYFHSTFRFKVFDNLVTSVTLALTSVDCFFLGKLTFFWFFVC